MAGIVYMVERQKLYTEYFLPFLKNFFSYNGPTGPGDTCNASELDYKNKV